MRKSLLDPITSDQRLVIVGVVGGILLVATCALQMMAGWGSALSVVYGVGLVLAVGITAIQTTRLGRLRSGSRPTGGASGRGDR